MRALILLLVFLSSPAFAYVNPGAGITFLGAVLGFLAALVFVVIGLVLWPVRRYLQYKKARQAAAQETTGESQDPPARP
jgi:ABC-type sulfate transport system permease component